MRIGDAQVDHYYVFVRRNAHLVYERTCGSKEGARRRVNELRSRGGEAFYLHDELPQERWFY